MRNRGLLSILAAALAFALAPLARAQPQAEITPALFVVRDADSSLYLYGTVHALPPGAPWANQSVRAAILASDEIWTESDISEDAGEQMSADFMRAIDTPAAQPLPSRLAPALRSRLRLAAKRAGLGPEGLDRFDPWEAAFLLMSAGAPGRTSQNGVDNRVAALAQENGKTLRWLEDMGVRDFEAMSESAQIQFLSYVLEGFTSPPTDVDRADRLWASGDLEGLDALELAPMRASSPDFYAWIVVARNAAWVERLSAELDGAGADFVAIGTAHLMGPDSVVAMLRARGYVVERVAAALP